MNEPELPLTVQDAVNYFREMIAKAIIYASEQEQYIPRKMRVALALVLFPIWMFFIFVFSFYDFL